MKKSGIIALIATVSVILIGGAGAAIYFSKTNSPESKNQDNENKDNSQTVSTPETAEQDYDIASKTGIVFNKDKTELLSVPKNIQGHVKIPYGVKIIKMGAFIHGKNLTSVSIPDSVKEIEAGAFGNCKNLIINIPDSVTKIDGSALSFVKQVNLSSKNPYFYQDSHGALIKKEGAELIYVPKHLTTYKIPKDVRIIGNSAFELCDKLTDINIPDGIKEIKSHAFFGCVKLNSIAFPDSLISIDHSVFSHCTKLTVNIPDSVANIKGGAFDYVRQVKLSSKNPYFYQDPHGALIKKEGYGLCYVPAHLTTYKIPENVTKILSFSFSRCDKLSHVEIPDSVKVIEDWAFSMCKNLKAVSVPKNCSYSSVSFPDGCKVTRRD